MRLKSSYLVDDSNAVDDRFEIEGNLYLTNDSTVQIEYIKKVTDPTQFDALFVECLVLLLAKKLLPALALTGPESLKQDIDNDLNEALSKARTVARQEINVSGRKDWLHARNTSGVIY